MSQIHTVAQGERLASIAAKYQTTVAAIYDAPANAAFRRKRPNPNLIFPGDQIVIPDRDTEVVRLATGQRHRFIIKVPKRETIRIKVADLNGTDLRGRPYKFVAGNESTDGTVSGDGTITVTIPIGTETGRLSVSVSDPEHVVRWDLRIGHLDPISEVSGVQARLENLGYYRGEVDGALGDELVIAIQTFQRDHGLPQTGQLEDILAQLEIAHDDLNFPPGALPGSTESVSATFDYQCECDDDGLMPESEYMTLKEHEAADRDESGENEGEPVGRDT